MSGLNSNQIGSGAFNGSTYPPQDDTSFFVVPVIFPRPVTGHRRLVRVSHPFCGTGNLLTTEASWSDSRQPNYLNYAYTPPTGPKQRTIHTAGPDEITWNISGELTNSTIGLLGLMDSNSRGVQFNSIFLSQGINDSYLFSSDNGFIPWSNFSVNGSQNGAVSFTLEGRSTQPPTNNVVSTPIPPFPDVPLPSWFTGNDFVTAWSLSHSVNLTPNWQNTPSIYPYYYRPGHSEFNIQVTTKVVLEEYSLIRFGVGGVSILEAVVTSRSRLFGARNEPVSYQVTTTNARISDQNAFSPSTVIDIPLGPVAAGFS